MIVVSFNSEIDVAFDSVPYRSTPFKITLEGFGVVCLTLVPSISNTMLSFGSFLSDLREVSKSCSIVVFLVVAEVSFSVFGSAIFDIPFCMVLPTTFFPNE